MQQCKEETRSGKNASGDILVHLCARQWLHSGLHECFCGLKWRRKPFELCQCWRANTTTRYAEARPNKFRVTAEREIEMFDNKRLIEMGSEQETGGESHESL